ncbi:hypothetical protein CRG98_034362, partial [Punica granatum]
HLEFAKRKKRIAVELCDKEKLSDSYLVIGESYQKLRNFVKALKWYNKSWEIYQSIGNMEGQALVKINIGTVLDCDGNWRGALNAYEEGYRIAVEANLPSIQLSALENMHYSHMIRFDNIEEARRLQLLIDKLKQSDDENLEAHNMGAECCSETDTEGDNRPTACSSPLTSTSSARETELNYVEELTDDTPLVSFLRRNNRPLKLKTTLPGEPNTLERSNAVSPSPARSSGTIVGRKRVHLVLSDDEDDAQADTECGSLQKCSAEAVGTSGGSGCSKCNFNAREDFLNKQIVAHLGPHASANKSERFITFQIDDDLVRIEAGSFLSDVNLSIESLKAQLACLYYLQLPTEKRLKGLLPIIEQLKSCGRILERLEAVEGIEDLVENGIVEVLVGGWIQKPLMKLYVGCCEDLSEAPNLKLLTRLYNLEVSEDEVIVSDCELQDVSVTPLLNALNVHGTIAMLNLSHNLLGQNYGDLSLDLHCNRFGPTALFQICESPVLFARLVVLNISGNRLTDACGSYISTILKNCKALDSLNIERCSISSRTIQKVADAIEAGSMLSQLWIGNSSVKELDLAYNVDEPEREALQRDITREGKSDDSLQPKNPESSSHHVQNDLCALNHECSQLEVADSEDERTRLELHPCGMDQSCASSCDRVPLPDCPFIEKLSAAIGSARQLELLDLSNNGFSSAAVESFYASWSNSRAVNSALRHADGQVLHLSVPDNRCCRVKSCCRRD